MPLPSAIMSTAASFLNDTAQSIFTNAAQLPYFNQALRDLQEQYELYDIPVTYQTSTSLPVAEGVDTIAYTGTTPSLPTGLIEIKQLWESPSGQSLWTPMRREDFLPHYLEDDQLISQFLIWAWINNEIHLIAADQDNDLKLDYIRSVFTAVTNPSTELGAKFETAYSYLAYRTAAHCARYIGENPTRADELGMEAERALSTALGIAIKGQQPIMTRRKPFRYSFRRSGLLY